MAPRAMIGLEICHALKITICGFFFVMLHGLAFANPSSRVPLTVEEKAWLSDHTSQIELWYNDDFPPIEFANGNGDFVGLGADIFALVEEKLGIQVAKKCAPDWVKHLKALKNGECAIAPTIVKTPEREKYAQFTKPYIEIPIVIIGPTTLGSGLSLSDLSGKKIAIVKGFATEEFLTEYPEKLFDIIYVDDVLEGLRITAFGQVEAFVANLAVASYHISQQGISNLKVAGRTDYVFNLSIGVSNKYPLLFSSIQKALDTLSADELTALKEQWITLQLPHNDFSPRIVKLVISSALFLGALVICLLIISFFLKRRLNEKMRWLDQTKLELLQSEAEFRSFFENAPLPFAQLNVDTGAARINRCFTRTFGYTNKDLPNMDAWWPLAYPDPAYRITVQEQWEKAISDNRLPDPFKRDQEFSITSKTGEVKEVVISANHFGRRVLITLFDITELNHYQSELEKSADRFQTLFDVLPFSCVINDPHGRFLLANKYFCQAVQKSLDQIVGCTSEEVGQKIDPIAADKITNEIIRNGEVNNVEATVHIGDQARSILYSSKMIEWEGERAILSATVDITDRKLAVSALQASEENLRVTLNSIGDAVITTDMKGRVTRMNPVARQLTGWSTEEAQGQPLNAVFHIVSALTREPVQSPFQEILATGQVVGLANHTLLISRNGDQYHIADSGAPIRNDNGKMIGVVLVFRDITGEYQLQEQLRQSQKMEAIGVLAGGIAHDFNNILSALMGFTDLAKLQAGDNEKLKRYLNSVSSASFRARDLVQHILTFSRKADIKKHFVYLIPILKETLKFIRASLPANIEIRQQINVKSAQVFGDATQLHQVMMNLFTNAAYAMKAHGGQLDVTLDSVVLDKTDTHHFEKIKPGRYFHLTISDTGCGIPKGVMDRIFEPFFTTKRRKEGTGMGLSTVYGILQEMGGAISVDSEDGIGTTFKVLIPEKKKKSRIQNEVEYQLLRGEGQILIVDDELPILEATQEILGGLGYTVTATLSSHDALKKIEENPKQFDLVLTDMTMPEMNGLNLSRAIQSVNPEIPIVLCTGFGQGITNEIFESAGIVELIMKPLIASELSLAIHNALKR